jgi:hypothetical protein
MIYTIIDKRLLQGCPSANPCASPHFFSVRNQLISSFRLFSALGFAKRRLEHHPDFGQNTKNFLAGAFAGL